METEVLINYARTTFQVEGIGTVHELEPAYVERYGVGVGEHYFIVEVRDGKIMQGTRMTPTTMPPYLMQEGC